MFSEIFEKLDINEIKEKIYSSSKNQVLHTLESENISSDNMHSLFSPSADEYIEMLAEKSFSITRKRFGNTIQLYAPLYLSNECSNNCLYCGFNIKNDIKRSTLTRDEIEHEADSLFENGFRHILLLTGEDMKAVSVDDLSITVKSFKKRFSSISIEVFPMEIEEYSLLNDSGVDGLTIYQETYNRETYAEVHAGGRKKDFNWRLNAPDRGGIAGFSKIGIGSLLGLSDWRIDGYLTALHARYLSKKYWKSQIQISFPRITESAGNFKPPVKVSDRDLTHLICSMRLLLPDSGLSLSTREPSELRNNLIPLGITQMSAGSKTSPGGYTESEKAEEQFAVSDSRTPSEIETLIKTKGFDPVWKDWDSAI